MPTDYIYRICISCDGTGKHPGGYYDNDNNYVPGEDKDCDACGGTGKYLWGYLEDELIGE